MKMLLIFSHQLTEEQKRQAKEQWEITEFVFLPPDLQARWSNIPPDGEWSTAWVQPVQEWVRETVRPEESMVLVQGEFGATYAMVRWLQQNGYRACYATTNRKVMEHRSSDGTIEINRVFRHIQFRLYTDEY